MEDLSVCLYDQSFSDLFWSFLIFSADGSDILVRSYLVIDPFFFAVEVSNYERSRLFTDLRMPATAASLLSNPLGFNHPRRPSHST